MSDIFYRLNKIEDKITDPDFRQNRGLGNEVGYYIFDYSPKDELQVRNHVNYLKKKINKSNKDFMIVEFDLYHLMIEILKNEGYFEDSIEIEQNEGTDTLIGGLIPALGLSETGENNLLVTHIVKNTPQNSVVFITGVGKCFPIIRSHNVLNNLHQVLDKVPVIMFFPGNYSGQALQLFGTIKDDNYYRAFRLI